MDKIIKLKETLEIFKTIVCHYIDLCLYCMYVCVYDLCIGTYIYKGFVDISTIPIIL